MNSNKSHLVLGCFILTILNAVACSEWQTTPVTVDKYRGVAVNSMIDRQTLNPHPHEDLNPIPMDGQKGQGVIKSYRQTATDLRQGKRSVLIDSTGRRSGSGSR